MGTILLTALGLAIAAANLAYWWLVVRRWEGQFRLYCERRYNVSIKLGFKGHWTVTGEGSWLRRFAIEWLQLVFFLIAFIGWAAGMLLCVGLLSLA
jgi:hypothetical protein